VDSTNPEQTYRTMRYRPGDEVTVITEHGPRHGRITAYGEQHSYVVQVNIPQDEITLKAAP